MLATLLAGAQWGALVHGFEHKVGTPQIQVCTTCVAASQLGAACIDVPVTAEALSLYPVLNANAARSIKSHHALAARQRGPPSTF